MLSVPMRQGLRKNRKTLTVHNLRTIYEAQQENTELTAIREIIHSAQNIYITGFGFNKKNCDLIFPICENSKRIFINTYDRTEKEINEIKNTLTTYFPQTNIKTKNATEKSNYTFMREYLLY